DADELAVDELDRADIQAAGRLDGKQDVWIAIQFAGDDQLLLVAAGKGPRGRFRRWRANVVALHQLASDGLRLPAVNHSGADERFSLGVPQQDVLPQGEVQNEAAMMPVFRDIGDTGVAEAIGIGVGDVLAGDGQGARLDLPQAGEDLDQLGLAVAFDAADPEDLPATQLQALDIDDLAAAVVVRLDVPRREDRRARRGGRSGDGERDIASDHEVGELLGGRVLRL